MGPPAGTNANPGMNNAGSVNSGQEGADRTRYVRSRKRFKVYTWKYKKTITPIASFILLVNQIFGFGMNSIPSVIAEGGLLRVFLANLATCIIACICSLMLLKSMTFIPHNSNFQQRIEYNTLVKYYLSDFYFKIISFLHYIGDFCTIVCGIITFSKLVDMLFIKAFGFTLALQVYPRLTMGRVGPDLFVYIYETTDPSRPFGVVCITLGYLICTLICTKLSCSSLEETTHFHVTSFLILLGCSVQLCVYSVFSLRGGSGKGFRGLLGGLFGRGAGRDARERMNVPRSRVGGWLSGGALGGLNFHMPRVGARRRRSPTSYGAVNNPLNIEKSNPLKESLKAAGSLGAGAKVGRKGFLEILLTFVDNYSLASTLPSWANEMTNQVNPTQTIWLSSLFAFFIYLVLGMLFSKTFSTLGSTSILDDILNSSYNFFVNCSISLFVIVTSIPDVVFGCISLRYNLLNLGYLNSNYSYFWGCVFPFMFTWLLVNDKLFQNWLGNLGLISALICDFFVPVLLYTVAYSRDYSDFTKLRRTSKLQIVSGWLHSRLGYLYSTSGTMYNRLNTVYNSLLSAVSGSGSSGKSLPRRGTKGHQANVPEGLEKGESSTTISSASDSTYSRGDSGASTSSTDTASVLERGVSGMARPHYGVDRSGSKESTTSASRKDTGNFRTFSAFLSRDSFMSNRLFRAGNRLFTGTNRLLGTTFSKSISLGSFGRSFSSILNRRGTGFTNTTDTGFTKSGTKETTTSEVDGEGGKVGEADKVGESRTRVSRFNTLSGKNATADSGSEDAEKIFKSVNDVNLVLKMLAPKLAKGDLSSEFRGVEGSDGALETLISIQSDLKRLLLLVPMKFITVTLIDEYVKMTNMDSDYSLNSSYLIVNNPVYYLLLLLNMLNASCGAGGFSSRGRQKSGRSDEGGILTRANTLDSAEVVLETLKDIYDPFELNDIKNIRIVINDLKVVRMNEIDSYNFKSYSLDHLTQFSSQLQGQLKVHQDHQRELVYMLNETGTKGSGSKNARNGKARKNKLDEEIRQNVHLMNKQQRLLYKIKMEINNRHLHILVIIYIYLNLYSISACAISRGGVGTGLELANGDLYSSSSGVNSIFNIYIMPILTSFSTSSSVVSSGSSNVGTNTRADNNYGNNGNMNRNSVNRRGSGNGSTSTNTSGNGNGIGGTSNGNGNINNNNNGSSSGNQGMSSDSAGDSDGETGGDEGKDGLDELEYYNNTIVLMCLCIYNIVTYPQTSGTGSGGNSYGNSNHTSSSGSSNGNSSISKANEKNASLYKELGIYYVLLNNLISMLENDTRCGNSGKNEKKSPTRSSIEVNKMPMRDNDIYIYKLEIILKIIVDLLHLLHVNNVLAGTNGRDKNGLAVSGSGRSGSSAKGGSKGKSKSSEAEGSNSGVNEEVVDGIFEKMLQIINGSIKINSYVHSIVIKLLVKTVPMVNTQTLLTSYTVCMLELLLFVPPGISSNARGVSHFTGAATSGAAAKQGMWKREGTATRPIGSRAIAGNSGGNSGKDYSRNSGSSTGTNTNASTVNITTSSGTVTLGDLDRLVLFNVISNLYNKKYDLVNSCIGEVISTTFKYLLSGEGALKEEVLCRFKFFFIYLFNVHRSTTANRGDGGNSSSSNGNGNYGNGNNDSNSDGNSNDNNYGSNDTGSNSNGNNDYHSNDRKGNDGNSAARCKNDIYGHVASIFHELLGVKYVNVNELLFLVQYLLNTTTGDTFDDEGRSGLKDGNGENGDSESTRDSNKQLLYVALKRYYEDNHKYLKSNKLVKLVLDQLSFSVDTTAAAMGTAVAASKGVKSSGYGTVSKGSTSGARGTGSDYYEDGDWHSKMYRTPTASMGAARQGTTPYCKFLCVMSSAGKTPSRSVRRSRRRQESVSSEESYFTVTSDTTELTENTEETLSSDSEEDSETSSSEY